MPWRRRVKHQGGKDLFSPSLWKNRFKNWNHKLNRARHPLNANESNLVAYLCFVFFPIWADRGVTRDWTDRKPKWRHLLQIVSVLVFLFALSAKVRACHIPRCKMLSQLAWTATNCHIGWTGSISWGFNKDMLKYVLYRVDRSLQNCY